LKLAEIRLCSTVIEIEIELNLALRGFAWLCFALLGFTWLWLAWLGLAWLGFAWLKKIDKKRMAPLLNIMLTLASNLIGLDWAGLSNKGGISNLNIYRRRVNCKNILHFLLAAGGAEILHSGRLQPGRVHVQTEHPARVVLLWHGAT
jgi:hypothetical protein